MTGPFAATEADLVSYRKTIGRAHGESEPFWSNAARLLRSIVLGLRETSKYAYAVRNAYGVGRLTQFSELATAHFHVGLSGEEFYLHQYFLPERRGLWRGYARAYESQWQLIERHRCEDFEVLRDKVAFSRRAEISDIPTIPILARLVDRKQVVALEDPPLVDLFSKPSTQWKGNGAILWRYAAGLYHPSDDAGKAMKWDELLEYLCKKSKGRTLILQAAARNHQKLRPLTNGALATIRIVTCRTPSGSIDIMPPVLKMPWGSAVADNMAQGGLVAPIDSVVGQIAGPAYRKDKELGAVSVAKHPNTGETISGFEIPFWRESIELSIRAHSAFSSMFFVGWDVAILDAGPVILEGNPLWDADVILLAHRIPISQTQFVPYWLHHYGVAR